MDIPTLITVTSCASNSSIIFNGLKSVGRLMSSCEENRKSNFKIIMKKLHPAGYGSPEGVSDIDSVRQETFNSISSYIKISLFLTRTYTHTHTHSHTRTNLHFHSSSPFSLSISFGLLEFLIVKSLIIISLTVSHFSTICYDILPKCLQRFICFLLQTTHIRVVIWFDEGHNLPLNKSRVTFYL